MNSNADQPLSVGFSEMICIMDESIHYTTISHREKRNALNINE